MSWQFNPFTGTFDKVNDAGAPDPENFSYKYVQSGQTLEIPEYQEMLLQSDLMVDGDLLVNGDIFQLPDQTFNSFFFTKIKSSESILIPEDRLMLFANNLMVDGNLLVYGDLTDAFFGVYY
jgi:hypothetical protein